ncbi:hypothetical protein [Bifidobacterium tissieri]|uniref:hypothetical protein n=1 Tax=Bifidobacterium tissieri TaxID=1630162 RepID=UPI0013039EC9|nr:hypothetical protein [Bifidobacterium tissieri]
MTRKKEKKKTDKTHNQQPPQETPRQPTSHMLAQSFQKPGHNQTLSGTPTTQAEAAAGLAIKT